MSHMRESNVPREATVSQNWNTSLLNWTTVQILGKCLPQSSRYPPGTHGGAFCGPGPTYQMSLGTKVGNRKFPPKGEAEGYVRISL